MLWHERLGAGADGEQAVRALLDLAATLGLAEVDGAGLLEIPAHANGRGLREAGVLPNAGPALGELDGEATGSSRARPRRAGIAAALAAGELSALYLLDADPLAGPSPLPSSEHLRSPWRRSRSCGSARWSGPPR